MDKIDIVIMWVDGADEDWNKKKSEWQKTYGIEKSENERYRDWDTLKYLFRGIEKYANWVNHVYLVTDNQVPQWLDTDHKKVTVVDHQDFIPKEFLPTFNSHSIELNLHRIDGLSENFVLFNDDMFIVNHVEESDFFKNGKPMDTAVVSTIVPYSPNKISRYIYNNVELINDNFSKNDTLKKGFTKWFSPLNGIQSFRTLLLLPWTKFTGFHEPHLCVSYNKSTFIDVWNTHEDKMISTTKSKFRENHNFNQWVMRYWQLASNNFSVRHHRFGKVMNITDQQSVTKTCHYIENKVFKVLCVNDTDSVVDFSSAKNQVVESFEILFPNKSSFEGELNV